MTILGNRLLDFCLNQMFRVRLENHIYNDRFLSSLKIGKAITHSRKALIKKEFIIYLVSIIPRPQEESLIHK